MEPDIRTAREKIPTRENENKMLDSQMEHSVSFITLGLRWQQMIKTVVYTHRTVTEQRNVASVSPKILNVLVNPIERHELIHQAEISGTEIIIERHPAEDIRSILNGDDDYAFGGQV